MRSSALLRFAAALCSSLACAQIVWNGGGSGDNWSTAASWVGGTAPANNGTATVQFAGSTRTTPTADVAWSLTGLAFNSGASAFTVSGEQLTLGSGGLTNNSSATQTITNALVLSSSQTWAATSGKLVVGTSSATTDPVTLGSNVLTLNAAADMDLHGVITGAGSLVKNGAGVLTISPSQAFTGGFTINAGTVDVAGSSNRLGSGTVTLNGGAVRTNATTNFSQAFTLGASGGTFEVTGSTPFISGTISGSGTFTKTGSGTLRLSNNSNNWSGGTTISAGRLMVGGTSLAGSVTNNSQLEFNDTGGNTGSYLGNLTGTGDLYKTGAGGFGATGSLTQSGTLFVQAGTFVIGQPSVSLSLTSGTFGTANISSGATLSLSGAPLTAGALTGDGAITSNINDHAILGSQYPSVTVNGTGTQTFAGSVGLATGTLTKSGTGTQTLSGTVTADSIQVSGGTLVVSGTSDINSATASSATLRLSGDASAISQAIVNGTSGNKGVIELATSQMPAAFTLGHGGILRAATDSLTLSAPITITANGIEDPTRIIDTGAYSLAITGQISGTLAGASTMAKLGTGTLTLSNAANNWTGGIEIYEGRLKATSTALLGTVLNESQLEFNDTGANTGSYLGNLTGTGDLYKTGAGHFGATGALAQSGTLFVQAGMFSLVQSHATTLTSGTFGTANISSGATLGLSGTALTVGALTGDGAISSSIMEHGILGNRYPSVTINGSGTQTFAGSVGLATSTLTKSGTGTQTLSGTVTADSIQVSGGTLVLSGTSDINSATASSATLRLSGNASAISQAIVNGTNGNQGVIELASAQMPAAFTLGPGGILRAATDSLTLSAPITITANGIEDPTRSIDTGAYSLAITGQISGTLAGGSSMVKTGLGTLTLSNSANNWTGGIEIYEGRLKATSTALLGTVTNDAQLEFNDTGANTGSYVGNLTGTGDLYKTGAGAFGATGALAQSGTLFVQAGTLVLVQHSASTALTSGTFGTATISSGATLGLSGTALTVGALTGDGAISSSIMEHGILGSLYPSVTVNGSGTQTFAGSIGLATGSLTKSGTGTQTLSGTVTANTIQVSGGTLVLSGTADANSATASSGILRFSGNASAIDSATANGSGVIELAAAQTPAAFVLGDGGTLRAGTGGLVVSAPLALAAPGDPFSSSSQTIDTGAHTITLSGAITGSFTGYSNTFIKTGSGTLVISGSSNTFVSPVSVAAGTLKLTNLSGSALANNALVIGPDAMLTGNGSISGTLELHGIVAPGTSPGQLSVGATTFAAGAGYLWEINSFSGSASAGTNWDLLSISGALAIAATSGSPFTLSLASLTAGNIAGAAPDFLTGSNYSFVFGTASGGITGFAPEKFAIDATGFTNPFGGTWSVSQSGNSLLLNYAGGAIPEPSTYAAWAGVGMLLFAWHRRRRRAAA